MAGKVLEYSDEGVRRLFADIILQSVRDYLRLKRMGRIKGGWPVGDTAFKKDSDWGDSRQLCEFFWHGWCSRLIDIGGVRVDKSRIYAKLEPRIWRTLISRNLKG